MVAAGLVLRSEAVIVRADRAEENAPRLRVVTANVLRTTTQFDRLLAFVDAERPDVLVLQEWHEQDDVTMAALDARFPHRALEAPVDVQIYSKLPLGDVYLTDAPGPVRVNDMVTTNIEWSGQQVRLIALHASDPLRRDGFLRRDGDFARLAPIASAPGPVVVAGDLNSTVFSPPFAALLRATGLRTVSGGVFLAPTYSVAVGPLGLRIDHVLVRGLRPVEVRRGPDIRSDHYPLVVDLQMEPTSR